ncbi:MAG TPA: TIGR02680 family protein [Streptosporangiaceae bacterium]|nr:TIGR02680 family protein [Streptosporangiaceae bacterium]
MLPAPCSERWKPLRAGLVDLFYYDAEEFWFHDGRLLLRGNNGTGKSKVLALTLPFLLDGELAPHRVEPDGDRQKKMEWNLLLGGKHPHSERLGYTWLEFGRRAADGTAEFRTIGCGLKAVAGRGIARHWFFVTPQRVGADLHLLPSSRVPLTREKLRDELDGHGLVYDRAADYRRAVDEALFGLGEHRYEALINLLIQLRQPQLSKRPDEKLLSRALTEALPPISPGLVTTVAEAFRGLDEERDALRDLQEAGEAANTFLRHYRRYAMIAAKRKATGPRQAQSRYEQLGRDLTAAEEAYVAAEAEFQAARGELEELERERIRLEARREALRRDPAMRDAGELDRRREDARQQGETARERERNRDRLAADLASRSAKAVQSAERASAAENELHGALAAAAAAAATARCGPGHLAAVDSWRADLPRARRTAQAVAGRQAEAIGQLERLLADVAGRSSALDRARDEVDRLTAEIQAAADRVAAAEQLAATRAAELTGAYRGYQAELTELRVDDPDELIELISGWAATGDGENPARRVIDDAARSAGDALGRQGAELSARREALTVTVAELTAEIERLEAGGHDAPPAPYSRDPRVRDARPGAPLWKVTDFAPGVPDEHRAPLEAALEAAGIIDAWLTPDGDLITGDVILVSGRGPVVTGPSCAAVLVPAVNTGDPQAAAVPESAVRAALSAIGLGEGTGTTWVTVDGRWANGVLAGAWHKDAAGYVGEGAREAARRDRIARLNAELTAAGDAIAALDESLGELDRRKDQLAAEHRAIPSDTAVREAHTKAAGQRQRRQELRDARAGAERVRAERQGELEAARRTADEFAADTGLPAFSAELAAVRTNLADYRVALAALWPAAEASQTALRHAAEAAEELGETEQRLGEAAELAATARETATAGQELYKALLETAGAAVEELNRKLGELRRDVERRQADEKAARELEQQAIGDRGKAEGKRDTLRTEIEEATRVRDAAVAEFQAFAATGMLRVARPDLEIPDPAEPWPPTPAVILARTVNASLEDTDDGDAAWDRVQRKVTEEHKLLADAMARHGHSAGLTLRDGIILVDVTFQGRRHDVPGLTAALAEETEQRARLLSAREREILENHLLNEVAGTLHELITAAEAEVRQMNDELESRPTSTGMKLRLTWQQARDAPDGLDAVRHKLRQTIDAWSAADRAAVGGFLQQRIASEHASNPAAGWTEALTAALDYRRWHEFMIQRYQDGHWRPAAGPASGGERALAASVPLFAAASAHYKSAANPNAPRLIALDEAFAGVDDDSRAKCLGLLATFDMDVVMTSEREWGCYPQVPGLAICQLGRQDGIDAVLVTPWRWDGRERRPAPRTPAPA